MSEILLKIVNMSISASFIVVAVLILRQLLKKAPKWITVLLWAIVAVRLVCPFSFESKISLMPSSNVITNNIITTDTAPQLDYETPILNDNQTPVTDTAPVVDAGNEKSTAVLDIVWLGGIAILLIYATLSYLRLHKKVKTAIQLRDNIYQCETVTSPFVMGIVKPKIYLPFNISEQNSHYVIAHEKAHISRLDHIIKPIGFLILSLHWFNPFVWIAFILLCKDIELACDEKVIKLLDDNQRADYSEALLNLSVNRFTVAAYPLAFGEVGVKTRIKGVLNYKKPAFWIIILAVVAIIATSVCMLTNPKTENRLNKTSKKLLSVLNNETKFITQEGNSVYLNEYKFDAFYKSNTNFIPNRYAFIDMDNDGTDELVVHDNFNSNSFLILRKQEKSVYGYTMIDTNHFTTPKKDGTVRGYNGSYVRKYKTFSFNKENYEENIFAMYQVYEDGVGGRINKSTINGKPVSYEEIKKFTEDWENRPEAEWIEIDYIKDNTADASNISIEKVRKSLQIPENVEVTYEIGVPYYQESFGAYLAQVDFYEKGERVAGASVYLNNSELGSNILLYTTNDDNYGEILADAEGNYWFASGVGAWSSKISLEADGSFTGLYVDSDASNDTEYPNGTRYTCSFSGNFKIVGKADDNTYILNLEKLELEYEVGKEWIADGVKYIATDVPILSNVKELRLLLPTTPTDSLSEALYSWWGSVGREENTENIGCYGIVNIETEEGYFG